ncbi:phosphotransferase [Actinomyces bowdenii]|uniref:phosphotransferase n=1 Tax=Actinomyces bowdenii TaxID=131109 RepID=UPI001ABC1B6E|nr:phosphotransferase [Actinomyces bowdenii]MBO3725477.1 phosphotransferase [Actinomyces bowdenii]
MAPPGALGGGNADLGGRIRAAAQAGELRGVPVGRARVEALGRGESYAAWLVRSGGRARVVRVQRRATADMPRPMAAEFAALERIPPELGTSAIAMEPGPDNPLGAPYMVTSYVPGAVLAPQEWGPPLLAALAGQLARLHLALAEPAGGQTGGTAGETGVGGSAAPSSGAARDGIAVAVVPTTVAPASAQGEEVLAWWRGSAPWTLEHPLVAPLLGAWREALARRDPAFRETPIHPLIHGDVVRTNVVVREGVPRLIDFEWAEPGDVAKDLALIGGRVSGGPWYVPMGRQDVQALVEEYVRVMAAQAPRMGCRASGAGGGVGPVRWSPGHASVTDPSRLLVRRGAYELIDRMGNLLYCLSRGREPRDGEARETGVPGQAPCQSAAQAEPAREEAARYARWAAQIATGMAAALSGSRGP